MTIAAAGTAYTTVQLTKALDFNGPVSPQIQTAFPDRLVAVVLAKVTAGDSAPGVAFVQLHNDPQFKTAYHFFGFDNGRSKSGTPVYANDIVPPGTYRLYLITRGSNRVTVTLPGAPPGTSFLAARTPTTFDATESTPAGAQGVLVVPQDTAVSTLRTTSRPLMLGLGWAQSVSASSQAFACATQDPEPDATTNTPYCEQMGVVDAIEPSAGSMQIFDGWYQPQQGYWQFKHNWAIEGAVTHGGGWVLQLALGDGYPAS